MPISTFWSSHKARGDWAGFAIPQPSFFTKTVHRTVSLRLILIQAGPRLPSLYAGFPIRCATGQVLF